MKRVWVGWLVFLTCLSIGAAGVNAESAVECSAVKYCETELTLSDQKAPIVYDGSGGWLDAIEKYFDIDVRLVNGSEKAPLTDAKLIYACSADGLTFDSCQTGAFVEVGSYTLRVSVEADDSRYYLPVYADTKVTISDAAALKGLTIQYSDDGATGGTAVEDWESYQPGDSAIILGNFGIDADGNPDPLVRPGYALIGWREAGGVREFSFGETVVMAESLSLIPIWSDGSPSAAAGAPVPSAEPTAAQPDEARLEAIRADAVQFYPVRADGNGSDPVLLYGAKTVPNGPTDSAAAAQPQTRVLDGFFTPDGEETRLIIRQGETTRQPTAAPPVSPEAAVTESELITESAPTESEAGAVTAADVSAVDNPFVPEAGEPVLSEDLPEPDAAAETGTGASLPSAAVESGSGTVPEMSERSAEAETAVPFAVSPTPTPAPALAAKQAILPVPAYPPSDPVWGELGVLLPETGLRLTGDEAIEPLDPVGMVLELPAYGVKADIVVVPFIGNTWDVQRLRNEAGVLEGFDLPGEGVSILAGHNHLGPDESGPFVAIGALEMGARIFVRKADGTLLTFAVYENMLVQPDEFGTIEALSIANPGSVVLVTCENEALDGGYSHRRAVFAKPVAE